VLSAADLNSSFSQIINNGVDLVFPATKLVDLNGFELVLDADADTSITADTDDRIDFKLGGQDLFRYHATVTSPVNGIDFVAAATSDTPHLLAAGTDANVNLGLRPQAAGTVKLQTAEGDDILIATGTSDAVNEVTITAAATSDTPTISATGDDTDINLGFTAKGDGVLVYNSPLANTAGNTALDFISTSDNASAVNYIEITPANTSQSPLIQPGGTDADVALLLKGKGAGAVKLGDDELAFPDSDGSANQVLATDGAGVLSFMSSAVLQVRYATKTDTFTTTDTSFTDITGLSVSITTGADANKVALMSHGVFSNPTNGEVAFVRLIRDSTAIAIGDTSSARTRATFGSEGSIAGNEHGINSMGGVWTDAPGTAGTYTYKLQMRTGDGGTGVVGRGGLDADTVNDGRYASALVAMEVLTS
jgi:hypothetical protein